MAPGEASEEVALRRPIALVAETVVMGRAALDMVVAAAMVATAFPGDTVVEMASPQAVAGMVVLGVALT